MHLRVGREDIEHYLRVIIIYTHEELFICINKINKKTDKNK